MSDIDHSSETDALKMSRKKVVTRFHPFSVERILQNESSLTKKQKCESLLTTTIVEDRGPEDRDSAKNEGM